MSVSYTSLEPDFLSALADKAPSLGDASSLYDTSTFVYRIFFTAIIIAALYGYALAGIWRMQGTPESISKSNKKFKDVTWGLFGVFGLFLIIFTVNKQLLTGDVGFAELKTKLQSGGQVLTGGGAAQASDKASSTSLAPSGDYAARKASHEKIAARLAESNITTNKNGAPCTEAQFKETKPSCTSLAYMPEETIQMILKLNASCKCTVMITGGTEPGHQTHGENKRAVDLRLGGERGSVNNQDPLYVYIKNSAANKLGSNNNCYEQYILFGFTFCDEKPPNPQHFHVR